MIGPAPHLPKAPIISRPPQANPKATRTNPAVAVDAEAGAVDAGAEIAVQVVPKIQVGPEDRISSPSSRADYAASVSAL